MGCVRRSHAFVRRARGRRGRRLLSVYVALERAKGCVSLELDSLVAIICDMIVILSFKFLLVLLLLLVFLVFFCL